MDIDSERPPVSVTNNFSAEIEGCRSKIKSELKSSTSEIVSFEFGTA
jgi:hypothetical protein